MFEADAPLSSVFVVVCLAVATLTAAFVFASGAAIGAIPAAVRAGPGSAALHRVEMAVAAMAAVFVAQQLLGGVQDTMASTLARRVEGDLRTRVFQALARPAQLDHLSDPEIQRRVAAGTTVGTARYGIGAAFGFGVPAVNAALSGAGMAVLLATFSWWLALAIVTLWLVVRVLVHREAVAYLAVLGFQTAGSQRAVYFRDLGLTPAAAKEIRIFGLAGWIVDRFRSHWSESSGDESVARQRIHVSLWLALPIVVINGLGFALIVNAAKTGGVDLRHFAIAVQALLGVSVLGTSWRDEVVVTYGAATIPPAWELEAWSRAQPETTGGARVTPRSQLRLDQVRFTYPSRGAPVLDGLSLDIPVGRSTAVVGVNGAGKTTLIKLLCGLLTPDEGSVLVDGVDLGDLDARCWRRQLAVLFQDFVHYPFTASDNVRFGAVKHPDDAETLARVAGRAGLGGVIAGLPRGWETVLNPQFSGGADLSGGEWQRIALARALWAIDAGARILVLDEPTANLDVRSEAAFYDRFLELTEGLTTILVSHRFASVRRADQIAVIADGRVAELGTHDQLNRAGSRYAEMFAAQRVDDEQEPADA
jgi:ATP-binding cassette, subfamily B, bacterial